MAADRTSLCSCYTCPAKAKLRHSSGTHGSCRAGRILRDEPTKRNCLWQTYGAVLFEVGVRRDESGSKLGSSVWDSGFDSRLTKCAPCIYPSHLFIDFRLMTPCLRAGV